MERIATPAEIVAATLFPVSDACSFMTNEYVVMSNLTLLEQQYCRTI
jgi:hypothetical protein